MASTVEAAVVRKSVRVNASVERAFSVFVEQMETWWPATHHIGNTPFEAIFVEPRAGGRGHDSPDWKFDPDMSKASEVEIRFMADGLGTLVELEHSKLERHGEGYEQLRALFDGPGAWEGILAQFAKKFTE